MIKTFNEREIETGKTIAIVSHLWFLGCIIAIFMNIEPKNRFAGFYIKQSIGIYLTSILLGVLANGFDSMFITVPFYLCFFILWIYSFTGALNGEVKVLPKIGIYFQEWFDKFSA